MKDAVIVILTATVIVGAVFLYYNCHDLGLVKFCAFH